MQQRSLALGCGSTLTPNYDVEPQKKYCLMPIRFVYTLGVWNLLGQKRSVHRKSKPMFLTS
jgi:hypothetical protein